ncbi:glycosyltransferase family 2 protein [Aphanothece hegewaldii]|nr:glycosyltransferase [Aphanothece hegewaldii]
MNEKNLLFSIIIPTYNRPERLKTCLESLTFLDFSYKQFEVIIVDDGSVEPLDPIVNNFKEKLQIKLIRQNNAGPASARNKGASQAQGEFLVFTDDDCQVDSNWLKIFSQGFEKNSTALLGGHTINYLSKNLYSEASQLLVDYLYDYYNTDSQQACFFTSNNFALSKELFQTVGGFDTNFPLAAGEDREFCDRWLFHNYPMQYLPKAIINHSHHLTLSKFWRQHFNYGCGAFYFHQVRSQRNQQKVKVEPFSFYLDLLLYPFKISAPLPKIPLAFLLFLSQVANISGFFWTNFQHKKKSQIISRNWLTKS